MKSFIVCLVGVKVPLNSGLNIDKVRLSTAQVTNCSSREEAIGKVAPEILKTFCSDSVVCSIVEAVEIQIEAPKE